MNSSLEIKEFDTRADLITTALRFYYENRDKSPKREEAKAWLVSEEGREYMRDLIKQVKNEEK